MPELKFSFYDGTGINRFLRFLPKVLNEKLEAQLRLKALKTKELIIRKMATTPKTGRRYRRKHGRIHIASSPGNPPAIDTGRLASNIKVDVVGGRVVFKATTPYASYVEKGTKKMKARPVFFDTINKAFPKESLIQQIRTIITGIFG